MSKRTCESRAKRRGNRIGIGIGMLVVASATLSTACGSEGSGTRDHLRGEGEGAGAIAVTPRRMTVVAETCTLDAFQIAALEQPALRRLSRELVMICPAVRASGEVAPVDPAARAAIAASIQRAKGLGYRTMIAATMGDDLSSFPVPYDDRRASAALADPGWREKVVAALGELASMADGLEIDFLAMPDGSELPIGELFAALDRAIRPARALHVMAPPRTTDPSDTPGGEAFDLARIARHVDRIRMMTLDYSCCGPEGGPSIDSGWAVDAARYAKARAGSVPVDVAFPLYGTDFSDLGERFVDYTEGRAIASVFGIPPERAIGGELHFAWVDAAGHGHRTWYPDAITAGRVLGAWSPDVLPDDVGVAFYGLGAEDPALFPMLARGLR